MSAAVIDFPTQAQPTDLTTVGVLVELDPAQVAQHPDNVRDPIDPDSADMRALIGSVTESGNLTPVVVVPVGAVTGHEFPDTITHVAIDGHRRQIAAQKAGRRLRCEVRDELADAKATVQTMLATGTTSKPLTRNEELRGIQQALDLGLSATKLGKAMGRTRQEVQTAAKAATLSAETLDAAADYDLTIDQLADLAEFLDDDTAADRIMNRARYEGWSHSVASERSRREEARRLADLYAPHRAELEAEGLTVAVDGWNASNVLDRLTLTDDPDDRDPIDPQTHRETCPGHAVGLDIEEDYEENADGDEVEVTVVTRTPICLSPHEHGHVWIHGYRPRTSSTSTPETVERLDDESDADYAARVVADHTARAEAAAAAEAARKEAESAERRQFLARNKAAVVAEGVRREFLHGLMSTKNKAHVKAMTGWAVEQIIRRDGKHLHWSGGPSLMGTSDKRTPALPTILGDAAVIRHHHLDHAATVEAANPTRHLLILWAHVCAAYEDDMRKDFHRDKNPTRVAYLQHLEALGYTLSEPERAAVALVHPPAPLIEVLADELDGSDQSAGTELAGEVEHGDPTGPADAGDGTGEVIDPTTETA